MLNSAINDKKAVGVAIIVGFKEKEDGTFNRGIQKDIEKMSNVFKNLKFAVCDYTNIRLKKLICKQLLVQHPRA